MLNHFFAQQLSQLRIGEPMVIKAQICQAPCQGVKAAAASSATFDDAITQRPNGSRIALHGPVQRGDDGKVHAMAAEVKLLGSDEDAPQAS